MSANPDLPVINFSASDGAARPETVRRLRSAARDAGFFYLRNFGVAPERVAAAFARSRAFFALPAACKGALVWDRSNRGYDGLEAQSFNPGQPGDLKESFRFTAEPDPQKRVDPEPAWGFMYNQPNKWPQGLPGFREELLGFLSECGDAVERVLAALEEAFDMRGTLTPHHVRRNYTMRLLRYPAVTGPVKNGQARCGEHTDWGTLTLLFQGGERGLEVQHRNGEWIPAPPIPGTVLVNIGDQLEAWTSGALVSRPHRVTAASSFSGTDRYSMALFCYADYDAPIRIGDARTSGDYVLSKLARTQTAGTVAAA
jgi:isopenicillin N synthase-like dioxygenase